MADTQQIIERIAREMTWWDTIRVKTHDEIVHAKEYEAALLKYGTLFKSSDYTYFETAAGERFLLSSHEVSDGSEHRVKDYFDGRKATRVNYDKKDPSKQETVSISRAFAGEESLGQTARPVPLKFFYVGKVPLYQALEGVEALGEEVTPLGTCDKYMFTDVTVGQMNQNLLYFLDKSSSLPLRVESHTDPNPAEGRKLWTWEVEEIGFVGVHPYAKRSVQTAFESNPERGLGKVRSRTTTEVVDVQYNAKFEEKSFAPEIEPQAAVHDTIAGEVRLPPPPKPKSLEELGEMGETSVGLAVPPKDWTPLASYASYGVGGVLLIVSLILWRRRG